MLPHRPQHVRVFGAQRWPGALRVLDRAADPPRPVNHVEVYGDDSAAFFLEGFDQ